MQYLIVLSALLSLVTAVLAQDGPTAAEDFFEALIGDEEQSGAVTAAAEAEELLLPSSESDTPV
jgi:hypothetical protein